MSKFTPGPWHIAGGTYSERWVVDSESPKVGKQNLIAMLQEHWKGNMRGDMDANAALVAAAPAMYEALRLALAADPCPAKDYWQTVETEHTRGECWHAKAEAALRAADGGE